MVKKKKQPKHIVVLPSLLGILCVGILAELIIAVVPAIINRQGSIDPKSITETYDPSDTQAIFNNRSIGIASPVLPIPNVLGDSTPDGEKKIYVDLTKQRLFAFEGITPKYDFTISSGKWGRTPTGTFRIWIKLRATRMTGGSKALNTFYDLPNVPYTMFFSNDEIPQARGFGIHGAYWHNNFGHPMSHGCINMRIEDAGLLYAWAQPDLKGKTSIRATDDNPGTELIIFGKAPAE